jgi:DNA-binding NarL/FixJ family response regulator
VDLQMPGHSGLELIDAIKHIHPATIVIVLTADRSSQSMATARQRGASRYLHKPIDPDDLVSALAAVSLR